MWLPKSAECNISENSWVKTCRLHIADLTQAPDTKLVKDPYHPGQYLSTESTAHDILENIMSYPGAIIDGKKYKELFEPGKQTKITPGQVNFLLEQINLQMQGYGTRAEDIQNYWCEDVGEPVK